MKLKLLLMLWCAGWYSLAEAKPYRPTDVNEVLETLALRVQQAPEIKGLRQQLAANPAALQPTLALARRYIELGRAQADPRYYGYAEAVLSPWVHSAQRVPEVLTLQATLHQNRHEFTKALGLLKQSLRQQPRQAQAWLTQAVIYEVQGQYAAALNSCQPLQRLATPLTAAVCRHSVHSLTGALTPAYQQLQQLLNLASADVSERQWALTTLAEMAERRGDALSAEQHYQAALATAGRNGYLLATYADFLLDQRRFAEVVTLLNNETRHDGLLLRLTLAEQALQLAETATHIQQLTARFAASRLRGDTTHQGDEARFYLKLLHDPKQALALARQNWELQREPRDTRILLEAAIANGRDVAAAQAALDLLTQAGLEDVRLTALRQHLT